MAPADSPTSPGKGLAKGDSKICGVCGDKALGYNFNAITCESCKAFFRRNALKKKEFKCPFNDNCKVDVVTRRFCQKCRLKKCFEIGMKKEWIMTDEEKKMKKQKIEENRQKRHLEVNPSHKQQSSPSSITSENSSIGVTSPSSSSVGVTSPYSSSVGITSPLSIDLTSPPDPSVIVLSPDSQPEAKVRRSSDEHLDVHTPTPQSVISDYESTQPSPSNISSPLSVNTATSLQSPLFSANSPADSPSEVKKNCTDRKSCGETMNNVLNIAIKSEFSDMNSSDDMSSNGSIHRSISTSSSYISSATRDLSKMEIEKLNELVIANRAMLSPVQNDPRVMGTTDPSLLNVINMTDIAIRRLIKMSKKINGFKNLCQEDQIALLKGGCTELMILRSVMTYDPEKECWQGPKNTLRIKLEVLREAKGNIYEEHKRFIQSFEPSWRADENIMLLLSAIALFNPDRANVIHGDVIKLEQDAYYYLLRRYLESLYYGCKAKSIYIKLLKMLDELHILNENHVRVFLDVNPKDVEPLLIEIFDLKNH